MQRSHRLPRSGQYLIQLGSSLQTLVEHDLREAVGSVLRNYGGLDKGLENLDRSVRPIGDPCRKFCSGEVGDFTIERGEVRAQGQSGTYGFALRSSWTSMSSEKSFSVRLFSRGNVAPVSVRCGWKGRFEDPYACGGRWGYLLGREEIHRREECLIRRPT